MEASLDSSYAFDSLMRHCAANGISKECVAAALAVVLMLLQSTVEIRLPPLSTTPVTTYLNDSREIWEDELPSRDPGLSGKSYYDQIFESLNQCITMSCTLEGIYSLLCGVLFDPAIPCNLIGAHLAGITEAIEPIEGSAEAFVRVMARKSPSTSPFWLAAVWIGQKRGILSSALAGMPPLSFPMASWTGIQQSFIQSGYQAITNRAEFITRAREFQNVYFITPGAPMPFTPSPPFGEIAVSGTSLEIRSHLSHDHSLIEYKTYWTLNTTDVLPTQSKHIEISKPLVYLPPIRRRSHCGSPNVKYSSQVMDTAERISSDATLNLFTWYRDLEDGLWLEEIQGKHRWIIDDSDGLYGSLQGGESPRSNNSFDNLSEKRIQDWRDEVLKTSQEN